MAVSGARISEDLSPVAAVYDDGVLDLSCGSAARNSADGGTAAVHASDVGAPDGRQDRASSDVDGVDIDGETAGVQPHYDQQHRGLLLHLCRRHSSWTGDNSADVHQRHERRGNYDGLHAEPYGAEYLEFCSGAWCAGVA